MKIVDIVKDRKLGMYVLDSTIILKIGVNTLALPNVHNKKWFKLLHLRLQIE